jgi:hypothetical protein
VDASGSATGAAGGPVGDLRAETGRFGILADRRLGLLVLALVLGLMAAVQYIYFARGIIPGDAFVYLGAGERLNAGHQLYALMPGDRPMEIKPPLWTVPLVSPPPIAVPFRILALVGDAGAYVWWILQLLSLGTALVMLARRVPPLLMATFLFVLLIPTVYEIGVGNLNSMLLLGSILTWRYATRGREPAAGAISGILAVVKLTPAMLVWWLLAGGRRKAVMGAIAAGAIGVAVSVLGAGLDSHLEYVRLVASGTAFGVSPLSLGGIAEYLGAPASIARYLPWLCIVLGLAGVFVFRRRPALAFGIAIVTMVFGSPAVSINWFVLFYALLSPVAWPLATSAQRASRLEATRLIA